MYGLAYSLALSLVSFPNLNCLGERLDVDAGTKSALVVWIGVCVCVSLSLQLGSACSSSLQCTHSLQNSEADTINCSELS